MPINIPKFASFRPKPTAPSTSQPPSSEDAPKHVKRPNVSEKRDNHDHDKRRKRTHSPPKRLTTSDSSKSGKPTDLNKSFFSDRRGDLDILKYGTLNRAEVPEYRRYGQGGVVGLPKWMRIDRDASREGKLVLVGPGVGEAKEGRDRGERGLRKLNGSGGRRERVIRVIKRGEEDGRSMEGDEDFVSLRRSGRKAGQGEEEEKMQEEGVRDFMRDEGERKDVEDDDLESDTEVSRADAHVLERIAGLKRALQEGPDSLLVWQELIQEQEALILLDRPASGLTPSDRKHVADLRITVYEEALKKIGKNEQSRKELFKGLLKEARRSWDDAKVARKWEQVLSTYPYDADLWLQHLEYVQTNFAKFKYEECRAMMLKCLKTLKKSPTKVAEEKMLHVYIRLTRMIDDAGYQELALAIWQAVLELRAIPDTSPPVSSEAEKMVQFEEFWESEAPRIGEEGSKGWRRSASMDPPTSSSFEIPPLRPSESFAEDFQRREPAAIVGLRYPGRGGSGSESDDPFHTIFSSDIVEFLGILPTDTSIILIIEAFLCFCGLPPTTRIGSHQSIWREDPFIQQYKFLTAMNTSKPKALGHQNRQLWGEHIKAFQMTSDLLVQQDFALDVIRLDVAFIRRVLILLAASLPEVDYIGEYLLAFETKHYPSEVAKTAKKLIKARSASLQLYNAFALSESMRRNVPKAEQIFTNALSMHPELSTPGALQLYYSYVMHSLRTRGPAETFWRLAAVQTKGVIDISADRDPDDTLLETARETLRGLSERALLSQDLDSAVLCTALLATLTYLHKVGDLDNALQVHRNLVSWFTSHNLQKSPHAEIHAQSVANLITYHLNHNSTIMPATIRNVLEPLISHFPNNTILLSVYATQACYSIEDRLHGTVLQTILQNAERTSIIGWAFAIYYETTRSETAGSTSHSIRALYKRATASACASYAALWRAYVDFELAQLAHERSLLTRSRPRKDGKKGKREEAVERAEQRVRDVFYAGMRGLPGCKGLFMMVFEGAKGTFKEEEKERVVGVMQEKEIRVYVEEEAGRG